ncbi:MAG: sugar phosphate isomerase/epimerase [Raineya sp.]|jgi:sugar phosphate isomerase/epimerase|nr:sugar phosphate isomerase/epimerase [Raineya sp.]
MNFEVVVSVENLTPETLILFEKLGVGIELSYFSLPWNLDKDTLQVDIEHYKQMLNGFSKKITMHGAFYDLNPVTRDSKILEVCKFRILQSIDIATQLNIHELVFHANFIPSTAKNYEEIWIEKQAEFWKTFIPITEQRNIKVFIENTREESPDMILKVLEKINHPNFKACYDTGHSYCFTQSKMPPDEWLAGYQGQAMYIHLHSNHGFTDEHIAFTKGNQNFDKFFNILYSLENRPLIVIEVKKKEDFLESVEALQNLGILKIK